MSDRPQPRANPTPVLVVDDEKNIRAAVRVCLEGTGCVVTEAATADAALAAVRQTPFEIAFVDLRLGTQSGMDLLPRLLAEDTTLDVIIVTAYATFDAAVEAVKRGARDFLPKPFTPSQIRHLVDRARERRSLERRVTELESRLAEFAPEISLQTQSPAMRSALALVRQAAASDASTLFRGESGTGKSVLARMLHELSARRAGPFVTVACPTLSEQLLSSELFGHARGAFTGAIRDQPGRVERANGGTLFLDEVAEMSPALQAQLLRFLQDRAFERLGEGRTRRADVRVVAATNRELEKEVAAGRFREDLLYRLNVVEVTVPPLRERREDIVPLARQFAGALGRANRRRAPELSVDTERMLEAYSWPGNVRELRNAIERALIVWPADRIEPPAFTERISATVGPPARSGLALGGPHTLEEIEREHVQRVLASAPSLEDAARMLGVDSSTLYRKRKRWEHQG